MRTVSTRNGFTGNAKINVTPIRAMPAAATFFLRIYEDGSPPVRSETVERALTPELLYGEPHAAAVEKAAKLTKEDGKRRWVVVEHILTEVLLEPQLGEPSLSLKELFIAEMRNQEQGGVQYATLASCRNRLIEGYNPNSDRYNVSDIVCMKRELMFFINVYGGSVGVEQFVRVDDYEKLGLSTSA